MKGAAENTTFITLMCADLRGVTAVEHANWPALGALRGPEPIQTGTVHLLNRGFCFVQSRNIALAVESSNFYWCVRIYNDKSRARELS